MTHLAPRTARDGGWFVRLFYFLARRRLGRVPLPIQAAAHNHSVLTA